MEHIRPYVFHEEDYYSVWRRGLPCEKIFGSNTGAMATDGHAHRSNTSVDRTHGELTHSLFKIEKQINTFYSVS